MYTPNVYKLFWIHPCTCVQPESTSTTIYRAVHSKCAMLMHRLPVDVHNIYKLFYIYHCAAPQATTTVTAVHTNHALPRVCICVS